MTKVLLPKNNSVWGVIVNPRSSNTYRHILSFEGEQHKTDFINKYLFNSTSTSPYDYKVQIMKTKEVSLIQTTALQAVVRINLDDYPDEDLTSLLNKDFLIAYTKVGNNERWHYYAITQAAKQGTQQVQYNLELDIFFTYDIKNMFDDKLIQIEQAHYDRISKTNPDGYYKYNIDSSNKESPIYTSEDFENNISNYKVNYVGEFDILYDKKFDFVVNEPDFNSNLFFQKTFKNIKWNYVAYMQIHDQSTITSKINNTFLPYTITAFASEQTTDITYTINNVTYSTNWLINGHSMLLSYKAINSIYSSSYIFKGFNHKTYFSPLLFNESKIKTNITITNNNITVDFIIDQTDNIALNTFTVDNSIFSGLRIASLSSNYFHDYSPQFQQLSLDIYSPFNNNYSFNNKRDSLFESKLKCYPYNKYLLKTSSKSILEIKPQFLDSSYDFIQGQLMYGLTTDTYIHTYVISNYYNKTSTNWQLAASNFFEDISNYKLPTDIDEWSNFLTNNTAQQNAQLFTNTIRTATGFAGAVAGGGSLLGLGAISQAVNSAQGIIQQMAQRQDIQNTPRQLQNTGSSILNDELVNQLFPRFVHMSVLENDRKLIYDHFYQYGYNFAKTLWNINELLSTRYYFNYIEADGTFEINKLQTSSEIKQIINDTLAQGVTIWHVRDLTTFKGIKNYEYENVEMSVL